jgi:hypothetical protein
MLIFLIPVMFLHLLLIAFALSLLCLETKPVSRVRRNSRRMKRKRISKSNISSSASRSTNISTAFSTSSASSASLTNSTVTASTTSSLLPSNTASLIGSERYLYCGKTTCRGKKFCTAYKENLNTDRIRLNGKKKICVQKGFRLRVVRMRLGLTQRQCVKMAECSRGSRSSQVSRRSISPRRPISPEPVSDSPGLHNQPVNRSASVTPSILKNIALPPSSLPVSSSSISKTQPAPVLAPASPVVSNHAVDHVSSTLLSTPRVIISPVCWEDLDRMENPLKKNPR